MVDALSLDLVEKRCVADQLVLYVGYDKDSLISTKVNDYTGPISKDWYGRKVPKHAHGSATFPHFTSSSHIMTQTVLKLYEEIVDRRLLIRRVNISLNHVLREEFINNRAPKPVELDLFADNDTLIKKREKERKELARERRMQETILNIKQRFGKNSLLRGLNFEEGSTARERNKQIGGHKA